MRSTFSFTSFLGRSCRIGVERFALLVTTTGLAISPLIALIGLQIHRAESFDAGAGLVSRYLILVAPTWVSSALLFETFNAFHNQRTPALPTLRRTLELSWRAKWTSFGVCALACLGLLLWTLPGVAILTVAYFAIPFALVDNRGFWASLKRSLDLSAGLRLGLLAINLGQVAIFELLVFPAFEFYIQNGRASLMTGAALVTIVTGSTLLFGLINAAAFHEFRRFQEGAYPEELAGTFRKDEESEPARGSQGEAIDSPAP